MSLDVKDWLANLPPMSHTLLEEADKWGVFDYLDINGEVHTAPVYQNGLVRIYHVLSMDCPCQPSIEYSGQNAHVVHNDLWS